MQDIISKKSIGERLRTLRLSKDLSQAEISETLGLSRSHYSQVELGKQFPSYQVLSRASTFYGKDYEWILHGSDMAEVIQNVKNVLQTERGFAKKTVSKISALQLSVAADAGTTVLVKLNEYITYQECRQDRGYVMSLPELSLPLSQLSNGSYRAFEVQGDEMESTLYYQDVAIGELVEDHHKIIISGVYIVVARDGIKIRRVVNFNSTEGALVCAADNKRYSSEIIQLEDIGELWEVKAKISFRLNQTINSISQYFQEFDNSFRELRQEVNKLKNNADGIM